MANQNATALRSPSPRGCSKPLMTHLTAEERAQLTSLADAEMRSLAAMARVLIVQGMASRASA
ncbi:MAG TPA: hypothetical protein ENH72_09675 [Pseudomonas sabulinigri]|uniref:Uncharacterized protein n=1 Tax=marine sediment metagenome TaxID=412755 RepID=A0A0F9VFX5_9ZZZZ|nr:hypothetical protein [Halopseudomonas sabulinigri]HEC50820.1 hypothetical protein [Halopseudomonas sabulinigri]